MFCIGFTANDYAENKGGIRNRYELTIVVKPIVINHGTVVRKDEIDKGSGVHVVNIGYSNTDTRRIILSTHLPYNFDLQPFVNV